MDQQNLYYRKDAAHGLRKAGATRAAENGATVNQLMALFGWKTWLCSTRASGPQKTCIHGCSSVAYSTSGEQKAPAPWSRAGEKRKRTTKTIC
jgi:hypothetical protein